ncbi:MAG: DUF5711 family protein [Oscillospiraceae bacterium]
MKFNLKVIKNSIKDYFGKFKNFNFNEKIQRATATKTVDFRDRTLLLNPFRIAISLLIIAILIILIINMGVLPHLNKKELSESSLESGGAYSQYTYGDDVLLLSNKGLTAIDRSGKKKWKVEAQLTSPLIDIDEKYILIADLDGNNYTATYKDGKIQHEFKVQNDIISAKVNKSGNTAIATEEAGYKGMVSVFNNRGDNIYTWHSGEGYIVDVDISDNSRYLAVSQMMSDGDEVYSRIQFIDIFRGEIVSTAFCESALVANITFDKNDDVVAVSDKNVVGYTKKGKQRFDINLAGKKTTNFILGNDMMTFLTADSRGNSILEIYSTGGRLIGTYSTNGEVKNVAMCGDTIALNTMRDVLYVNSRGKLKRTLSIEHDIKTIGIFGNERDVLVIGGNKADVVRIK